jgi:S-(hydroxymethyl)glutathione dehydrogenase/alcohol dehydrogenase
MKTHAAVLHTLSAPLSIEEIDLPELRIGQVLVEIAYSGVCHTQLSEVMGRKGPDRFLPHLLGHEGSGRVLAIGENVTKVSVDDHVVMTWIKGYGHDIAATQYHSKRGVINSGAVTTFQHHAIVSENRVVKISNVMPLREAALLGCAVATGAGMVKNTLGVKAGESLVIYGAGGIGLSALLAAGIANAAPLIVVDVQNERLAKALQLGATHVVNASNEDAVARVKELTGSKGAKYAVEAAGTVKAMEAAIDSVRYSDGVALFAGNVTVGEKIALDPFDLIRGKTVLGSWGGATQPDRDVPEYVEAFLAGKLPLTSLIDQEYSLSDVNLALSHLTKTTVGRAIIRLEKLSS